MLEEVYSASGVVQYTPINHKSPDEKCAKPKTLGHVRSRLPLAYVNVSIGKVVYNIRHAPVPARIKWFASEQLSL